MTSPGWRLDLAGRLNGDQVAGDYKSNYNLTMADSKPTSVRIPPDILSEVDRAARAEGVSRSEYLVRALRAHVRKRAFSEFCRELGEQAPVDVADIDDLLGSSG